MNYLDLRKKYSEFHYREYQATVSDGKLILNYYYDIPPDLSFKHTVQIMSVPEDLKITNFGNIVFNIGLVEMLSYWKLTASPRIIIDAGRLDDFQNKWWQKLFMKGMGQYFFENKIDFIAKDFVVIKSKGKNLPRKALEINGGKILIPVGGGKDSALTLELLGNREAAAFTVNETLASKEVIQKSPVSKKISVLRQFDPKMKILNAKGYLNGHVPYSATLAFISTLTACLFGYKYIAFSNERSADEENTEYLGQKINHQYSKTFEFENDFRRYNRKYLSNVEYFSFIRAVYELQIAKAFSNHEKYFGVIRSCNVGAAKNIWCEACPKCLSTYILLSPFLNRKMKKIFSKDLTKNPQLAGLFSELIDENKVKPFECVGTREELKAVLKGSYQKLLSDWGKHNIPEKFVERLKEAMK